MFSMSGLVEVKVPAGGVTSIKMTCFQLLTG